MFPNWGLPGYQPEFGRFVENHASIVHIPGHRLDPHLALKQQGRAALYQPQMRFVCPSASSSSLLSACSRPVCAICIHPSPQLTAVCRRPPLHPPFEEAPASSTSRNPKPPRPRRRRRSASGYSTPANQFLSQPCTLEMYVPHHPPPSLMYTQLQLLPGTRNEKVAQLFRKIGPIEQTIVRCSAGLFVSRSAVPDGALSNRDHHYATVRYHHPRSARKALALNGVNLDGRKLVVRPAEDTIFSCLLILQHRCPYLPPTSLKPSWVLKVRVLPT